MKLLNLHKSFDPFMQHNSTYLFTCLMSPFLSLPPSHTKGVSSDFTGWHWAMLVFYAYIKSCKALWVHLSEVSVTRCRSIKSWELWILLYKYMQLICKITYLPWDFPQRYPNAADTFVNNTDCWLLVDYKSHPAPKISRNINYCK